MCPRQNDNDTSLTSANDLGEVQVLNLEQEFRSAFPPWATLDISKSVENVIAQSQHKIEGYGQRGYQAFRRLFPRPPSSIEALPDDILVELFKTLGWREIFSLRQTCKRLEKISRAKSVWLAQLDRLSLALAVSPRLEDRRGAYSSQEVEDFVCSRISADIGWLTGETPRARSISPWPQYHDPRCVLVEGGRWLLIADGIGRVYAQDLDALSEREPELIVDVPPQDMQKEYSKQYYYPRVDVDRTEPVLTFNLGLIPYWNKKGPSKLRIYRVQLIGHGDNARLVSKLLNHFYLDGYGVSAYHDLSGNLWVRDFEPLDYDTSHSCVEVYDWAMSNQATKYVASINEPGSTVMALAILPESKIIRYECDLIIIYNIVKIIPIDSEKQTFDHEVTLETFWRYEFCSATTQYCHMSRPLRGSTATRITVSDGEHIFGVIVPHNGASPSAHLLSKDNVYRLYAASLGINKIYSQYMDHSFTINVVWPDDDRMPSVPLCDKQYHFRSWPFKLNYFPLFDEGSGRAVSETKTDGWKIFDFVGPKTNASVIH